MANIIANIVKSSALGLDVRPRRDAVFGPTVVTGLLLVGTPPVVELALAVDVVVVKGVVSLLPCVVDTGLVRADDVVGLEMVPLLVPVLPVELALIPPAEALELPAVLADAVDDGDDDTAEVLVDTEVEDVVAAVEEVGFVEKVDVVLEDVDTIGMIEV
ncbi:hypothetical protein SCAR479_09292 [Seiridium cardinale]|uniref:Uncharacterized protein n=1 Tax=Seiridium cardinale TaxID=138064 RepID=A0ABR2XJG3_9PEZI